VPTTPSREEFDSYGRSYHNPHHQFNQRCEYIHLQPSSASRHPDYQQQQAWSTVPDLPRIASRTHPYDGSSPTYPMPPSNADSPASSPVRLDDKPTTPPFGVKDAIPMPTPLPMTFSRYATSRNGSADRDQRGGFEWSAQIVGGPTPGLIPVQPSAPIASTMTMPSAYAPSTSTKTVPTWAPMHGDYAEPLPHHVPQPNYHHAHASYLQHMMALGPDHYHHVASAPVYGHVPRPYDFPDHMFDLGDDLYIPSSVIEHRLPFIDNNSNVRPLPHTQAPPPTWPQPPNRP
jgi:hypothetical protein